MTVLSIVMPAYDEAPGIVYAVSRVRDAHHPSRTGLIVINDDSADAQAQQPGPVRRIT
jgi:glycosyltransferase involved in cell wall biosynthesis